MTSPATAQPHAVLAFNKMADDYDDHFTRSPIGRAQRNVVWNALEKTFHPGDHILELNCGTGEDALFMSQKNISVVACDASDRMIQVARQRHRTEAPEAPVQFHILPTERMPDLQSVSFDGAFSNFSGLNCVADLQYTSRNLAAILKPGSPLLICMSTRFCAWEVLWYLLHGNPRKAFRRWSGHTTAKVGEFNVDVYYPTLRRLRQIFAPYFIMQACSGIGVAVPPSYIEPVIRRRPWLLRLFCSIDKVIASLPWFRVIGDHMLIRFERVQT
jgi:ubiquinone/menaquinone biosynthesis C-methylase UbiE